MQNCSNANDLIATHWKYRHYYPTLKEGNDWRPTKVAPFSPKTSINQSETVDRLIEKSYRTDQNPLKLHAGSPKLWHRFEPSNSTRIGGMRMFGMILTKKVASGIGSTR